MCTAISFYKDSLYFGRNMDIEYHFGEKVAVMPRDFSLQTKCAGVLRTRYAVIGMANVTDGYPLYADAMNEKGLCAAGLNFPSNAAYAAGAVGGKRTLAPYELIPYLLGSCADLAEAKSFLAGLELADIPFVPSLPVAPLHWMIADASGSIAVERTEEGLRIFENEFGVLTNNPPFPFHRENVRQYLHLSAANPEARQLTSSAALRAAQTAERVTKNAAPRAREGAGGKLSPFSQGAGGVGLPGDFSSASRFVKAWFCRENSICASEAASCVSQVFHVLGAVAMPRGAVLAPDGRPDMTIYACCMDAANQTYYYKTYDGGTVCVALNAARKNADGLCVFPLRSEPNIVTEG